MLFRACRDALGPTLSVPVPIAIDWLRNSKGKKNFVLSTRFYTINNPQQRKNK